MFKSIVKYMLVASATAVAAWIFIAVFSSVMDYSVDTLILSVAIFLAGEIAVCTSYIASKTARK